MKTESDNYASGSFRKTIEPRYLLAISFADDSASADQNLLTYSEQFDNGAWSSVGTPVLAANDATAPDGTATADEIEDDNGSGLEGKNQAVTVDGTARHVVSVFVKKDSIGRATRFAQIEAEYSGSTTEGSSVKLDTATGEIDAAYYDADSNGAAGVIDHSSTWWRVWAAVDSVDTANTTLTLYIYPAGGADASWSSSSAATGAAHFWGAQISEADNLLSYVRTEGTASTGGTGPDIDEYYLSSHSDTLLPSGKGGNTFPKLLHRLSGQTQKIKPDGAQHTIGNVSFEIIDAGSRFTALLYLKYGVESLRKKRVRLYKGFKSIEDDGGDFGDYSTVLTYLVDKIHYKDGVYTLVCSDIQRTEKTDIFDLDQGVLTSSISASATSIPITIADASSKFALVDHDAVYGSQPSDEVGYIIIDDEIICHDGWNGGFTALNVVTRGALGTKPARHQSEAADDSQKKQVQEYVYLEMPAPKMIYALLTGVLDGQGGKTLPDSWHLNISTDFVRLADFQGIGDDYWNTTTDEGRIARFMGVERAEGKKFIQEELLLWLACFMPVYSDGALGLERLRGALPDSAYDLEVGESDIIQYSALEHDYKSLINNVIIRWNWIHTLGRFTKYTQLIDATSISVHGKADLKEFEFRGVFTGVHSDNDIQNYFKEILNRYSNPPLKLTLTLHPDFEQLEVGDTVRVNCSQIIDYNTGAGIDRTFEVQQVKTDWTTGLVQVQLFGGIEEVAHQSLSSSNVLSDSYYTASGTELSTVLTISGGAVTANGSLTGAAQNTSAIYYYDGDLTINSGVTVSMTRNVLLRIKGFLTINGAITCTGNTSDDGYLGKTNSGRAVKGIVQYSPQDGTENAMTGLGGPAANRNRGKTEMPVFNILNEDGSSVKGIPKDLTGIKGADGANGKMHTNPTGILEVIQTAAGGNGGAGGGGLVVVCRGASMGASAQITTDGDAGSTGSSVDSDDSPVMSVYGQSGAGGFPGGVLFLIDGNYSTPVITSGNFEARVGDHPVPSGIEEHLGQGRLVYVAPGDDIYGVPMNNSKNHWRACARIQYIPRAVNGFVWTPSQQEDLLPIPAIRNSKLSKDLQLSNFLQAGGALPNAHILHDIKYDAFDDVFLIVGGNDSDTNGNLRISYDGMTWGAFSPPKARRLYCCASDGAGTWVALGQENGDTLCYRTTDIFTADGGFTEVSTPDNEIIYSVCWAGDKFVAVGAVNSVPDTTVYTSSDGSSWTIRTNPGNNIGRDIFWNGNRMVCVGSSGGTRPLIMYSDDGITWTLGSLDVDRNANLYRVRYGNGLWFAVGQSVNISGTNYTLAYKSTDGINWTEISQDLPEGLIYNNPGSEALEFGDGVFVFTTGRGTGPPEVTLLYATEDLQTFTRKSLPINTDYRAIAHGQNRFVACGEPEAGGTNQCVYSASAPVL